MSACVKGVQQADGSVVLVLDPANQNLSTCQYTVDDGATNAWRELGNMSVPDAQVLGVAVGCFWAAAWAFKQIGRLLAAPANNEE